MPLNDSDQRDFSSELEDEEVFDAHPHPGTEIGMELEHDYGSGSYAEDGRLEVAEDEVMNNGESHLGSAAMYGPTEIGGGASDWAPAPIGALNEFGPDAVGDWSPEQGYIGAGWAPGDGQSEIGHGHGRGHAPTDGQSEIGRNGGYIAKYGPTEIGNAQLQDAGAVEPTLTPFDLFMSEPTRLGAAPAADRPGTEIGFHQDDFSAIDRDYYTDVGAAAAADRPGTEIGAAVARVIEKARDNRQPPPPMRAVDVDAAPAEDDSGEFTDFVMGVVAATGNPNPFPLTTEFMQRCGAGMEPRFVRVDTEESYKRFRTENSPELAELSAKLEAHIADPTAHGGDELSSDVADDVEDLVHLGAEVQAAEDAKRVELWMPRRFDGLVTGWREGDMVCASLTLPGQNGELRICTSLEPISRCVSEMCRHATEAGVPASTVVGVLPAMGCVLGVGTALKEMAAAAPSVLARPEATTSAPFMVRIEPKTNPALCALAMLVMACRGGNAQACAEWEKLGALAPAPLKQAMLEAVQVAKAAG